MERGYVKLWRRTIDSPIFTDSYLLHLWLWILLRAAHAPRTVPIRTGRGQMLVELKEGQLIFGRHAAARTLNWSASTTYDRLQILKKSKMIGIQPGTHYSIITVLKWDIYQGERGGIRQPNRQATRHPTGTQPAHTRIKALKKNISYTPDFEKFWSVYPRRIGKQVAFLAWLKVVATYPPEDIISAAEEYAAVCKRERRQERYIMHPSTFLNKNRWWDYCLAEVSDAR